MALYHPEEYVWEVNSWAEPEGGYMIWPCCRALAENAPGCQERPAPPNQASGEPTPHPLPAPFPPPLTHPLILPKNAASDASSTPPPPPLDSLEAELKLKHSRKGVAATVATASGAAGQDDDASSAVAQALAASGLNI
jgi:hypothetical protein